MSREQNTKEESRPTNIRLRRMFLPEEDEQDVYIPERLNDEELNQIRLKFHSDVEHPTLVESVNQLIDLAHKSPAKALVDYLEELKILYQKEDAVMKSTDIDWDEFDIEQLIQKSQAELLLEKDQRSLLYELIDEIKTNSHQTYSDDVFEQNIQSMINETDDDELSNNNPPPVAADQAAESIRKEDINGSATKEEEEKETRVESAEKRRSLRTIFFFLFVIIGLIILYYLYKDYLI